AVQNFIPEEFALHPAYPNPFNPVTTIHYDVNQTGRVQLKVYDMMGREVAELVNGVVLAGKHRLHWNTPGNMASGIYLVQINNGQKIFNQRITLLK
ncbi:MAG: T9SS type A sorting domain-containing protein, partial [Candidatus Marinimicrobia bacterium]|nr:T9SS type A sorting domain-containing protein [Candidatus Neomarinimicrobiota bacterium]